MPTLALYMAQYDQEHGSAWNKILHGVGIPMFLAGIFLILLTKWTWGAAFFLGGWVFLFLGHRIEGNHPTFFQGPIYLLVGPIRVAKEAWMFLTGKHRKPAHEGATEGSVRK